MIIKELSRSKRCKKTTYTSNWKKEERSWGCCARTTYCKNLDRKLCGRAVKYNHFELKNIAFDEMKFPMLFWSCFVVFF